MTRARSAALLAACALAGALAAVVLAGPTPASPGTTDTTTSVAPPLPPTTSTSTTTTTAPEPIVAPGVKVGGVEVGGLTPEAAASVIRTAFEAPLVLTFDGRVLTPSPESLGATAYVQNAVRRALSAAPATDVSLFVRIRGERVRAYVARLAERFDRKPVDTRVVLRRKRPYLTRERPGRLVDRAAAVSAIVGALRLNERLPMPLPVRAVAPAVTRKNFGPVIVIQREAKWLGLYRGTRLVRKLGVATGQSRYPTPLGRFRIVVKWKNPWWYPPDSDWARGQKPIPPGPGNPLGTRWMGISAPGVGIHGTPDAASIGYSVSHGCIRLAIPDAEWLFGQVEIGTTVFIIKA